MAKYRYTEYFENEVADIAADDPQEGYVFDRWTGDTGGIADVYDATTTFTMGTTDATITATHAEIQTIHFREGGGTGYTDVTLDDATLTETSDAPDGERASTASAYAARPPA